MELWSEISICIWCSYGSPPEQTLAPASTLLGLSCPFRFGVWDRIGHPYLQGGASLRSWVVRPTPPVAPCMDCWAGL